MIGETIPQYQIIKGSGKGLEEEVSSNVVAHAHSWAGVCLQASRTGRLRWSSSALLSMLVMAGNPLATSDSTAQAHIAQPVVAQFAEVGMASWYGHPYHGRRAASGEIYDMHKLTAAHRTLPFGTQVRVHSLDNDKMVDVEINDRGPFVAGRIIDLSHTAARILGIHRAGMVRVWLEVRSVPKTISSDDRLWQQAPSGMTSQ